MKLSTEKIIAILPLDEAFKAKLKEELPTMDADTRTDVERTLWRSFATFYEIKLQENIQQAIAEGDVSTDGTLYQRMEEKTAKEIENIKHESTDKAGLDDVRKKLEGLINSSHSTNHE